MDAIILAAGQGRRYGSLKQELIWNGLPLWRHVHEAALAVVDKVILVGPMGVPGGATRQESVRLGLRYVHSERVVILEAARPLVTADQIRRLAHHPSHSVTYAVPSSETVVLVLPYQPFPRSQCYLLQTPQAFTTELLREAHAKTIQEDATDDTSLMFEIHGTIPELLPGAPNLHKLTYPEDRDYLDALRNQSLKG